MTRVVPFSSEDEHLPPVGTSAVDDDLSEVESSSVAPATLILAHAKVYTFTISFLVSY